MYIESVPNRNSPPAILVRESFRDDSGKVKKRTLANISKWSPDVIAGLKVLLKGGHASSTPLDEQFEIERSLPHGHVAAVLGTLRGIGLHTTVERKSSKNRALVIAMIAGRLLFPSSKLALTRHLNSATASCTLGEELGLDELAEHDLYKAMRWLLDKQQKIEKRLAEKHLTQDSPVLYDLTSTYFEGHCCVLAKHGYSRDRKRGKLQINIGMICNAQGCPVAVEVFPGNTADPSTVAGQIDTLRERFGLERIIMVGDRGMLTSARIESLRERDDCKNYAWISALDSGSIKKLVTAGDLQLELFDERDLGEISCEEHFPGERLVVCRNASLIESRRHKRDELLAATKTRLETISAACRRSKNPYRGKAKIAARVERECGKYKMLKHIDLTITETTLDYRCDEESIAREAALDGFYVIRAGRVSEEQMDSATLVKTYKSLSQIERAFRSMKTSLIKIRPIFHHEEDMVRAHVFVCMLACNLRWHMEQKLKPVLFSDEEPGGAPRQSPVAKAKRSERGEAKAADKRCADGLPAHSFATLLEDLKTLCRSTLRPKINGAETFSKLTKATKVQEKVFRLLNIKPKARPSCSQ